MEIWKQHPIHTNYYSSSNGEVKNRRGKIIKLRIDLKSYRSSVAIWRGPKRYYMSAGKFIYECFYGLIPEGLIVMHHDEYLPKPYINAPFNLFLGTKSINLRDAYAKNRIEPTKGAASGRSYLSQEEVDKIRLLRQTGSTYKEIQKEFPIPKSTLSYIINRKTWN